MALPTLTREPSTITAGDTIAWTRELSDFPASAWTLTYALRTAGAPKIEFNATADGDTHVVNVVPATSAAWAAGRYVWQSRVTSGSTGEETTVGTGFITIRPNYATATSVDPRSHARRMLDAIEAMLEGNASKEEESLTLPGGRTIRYASKADLLAFRSRYQEEVRQEEAAEKVANGLGGGNKILTRFVRP